MPHSHVILSGAKSSQQAGVTSKPLAHDGFFTAFRMTGI